MEIKESFSAPRHHLELYHDGSSLGTLDWDEAADEAQLIDIAIQESYRHKGYGHFLLQAMLTQAKNLRLTNAYLEVRRSNGPAIALYKKCGFLEIGQRRDYYQDPLEDALLFSRPIQL